MDVGIIDIIIVVVVVVVCIRFPSKESYTKCQTLNTAMAQYFTLPPRIRADSARTLGRPRTVLGLSSDSARTH